MISLESHTEQVHDDGARRPRTIAVLDSFAIDYGLCMYCGICIDVCPFDALEWRPSVGYSSESRAGLIHDTDTLAAWRRDD